MLVIDDRLLNANQLLQKHRMMHTKLIVSLLKLLKLLLSSHELCVNQIHLLGRYQFVRNRIWLSRSWGFAPNVVERVFVVHFEVWVLELPRLLYL